MPIPAALVGVAGPGAIAAAKQMAFHAAAYVDVYAFTSATFAAILARMAWKRLPDWIKEDISFQSLIRFRQRNHRRLEPFLPVEDMKHDPIDSMGNKLYRPRTSNSSSESSSSANSSNCSNPSSPRDSDGKEELSNLGSVLEKLQDLVESAKGANPDNTSAPVEQLHAAVMAHIQLSGQLKLLQQQQQQQKQSCKPAWDDVVESVGEDTEDEETKLDSNQPGSTEPIRIVSQRDDSYKNAGASISLEELQCKEHQQALEFATWAYYEDTAQLESKLNDVDYALLEHTTATRPGYVGYYVAMSTARSTEQTKKKQMIIGIKGTTSLEELLTDCCGNPIPFFHHDFDDVTQQVTTTDASERFEVYAARSHSVQEDGMALEIIGGNEEQVIMENHDDDGDNYMRCHEGIFLSALRMVNNIQGLLRRQQLGGYRLLLCGHSLGGGAAALAALILRSRFPELCVVDDNNRSSMLHVYAFAPPPVLDHDAAIAASSFCTSFVNNADVIPRSSLANVMVFLEYLRHVHDRLVQQGINPTGPRSTAAFVKKLSEGTGGTPIMTIEEVSAAMDAAHDKVELRRPYHLYIPGKVLLSYNAWSCSNNGDSEEEDEEDEETREEVEVDGRSTSMGKEEEDSRFVVVVDGTATVLRTLEFDGIRMFTDHVLSCYFCMLGMEYSF